MIFKTIQLTVNNSIPTRPIAMKIIRRFNIVVDLIVDKASNCRHGVTQWPATHVDQS